MLHKSTPSNNTLTLFSVLKQWGGVYKLCWWGDAPAVWNRAVSWGCLWEPRSLRSEFCLNLRPKPAGCYVLQPWSSKTRTTALPYTYFTLKIQGVARLNQSAFWSAGPPGALLLAAAPVTEPTQDSLWGGSGDPFLRDGHTAKKGFTKATSSEWDGTYSACQTAGDARWSSPARTQQDRPSPRGGELGNSPREAGRGGCWTTAFYATALASDVLSEKGMTSIAWAK